MNFFINYKVGDRNEYNNFDVIFFYETSYDKIMKVFEQSINCIISRTDSDPFIYESAIMT
jgi:hypothetical protein